MDAEDDSIATALTESIARDGQTTITANLPMSGFKHTGVGAATARGHYARVDELQDNDHAFGGTAGGTADALTASLTPTITAYVRGMTVGLEVASTNTGAATLSVDSVGAKTIKKYNDADLVAGDLEAGMIAWFSYEDTSDVWHMLNPVATLQTSLDAKQADVVTTRGDIIRGSSSNAAERLGLGTSGYVLSSDGTDADWVDPATLDSRLPRGYIDGLILSNNGTDADHDIDISAGEARDGGNTANMVLSSALTKQIDASWAVGTNQGGLDGTESVAGTPDASTWYHVWLIKRSDTGVVDALFSESATSPTMPSSYDLKRRIGSVVTDGSANIIAFFQYGDEFRWVARKLNVDDTTPDTSGLLVTMSVPPGVEVMGIFTGFLDAASDIAVAFTSEEETNTAASVSFTDLSLDVDAAQAANNVEFRRKTNTLQQIRYRSNGAVAAAFKVWTLGWVDPRGKNV